MAINFKIAPIIYSQENVLKNYHTKLNTIEHTLYAAKIMNKMKRQL